MKKENDRLLPGYLGGVGRLGWMPVREITVGREINWSDPKFLWTSPDGVKFTDRLSDGSAGSSHPENFSQMAVSNVHKRYLFYFSRCDSIVNYGPVEARVHCTLYSYMKD